MTKLKEIKELKQLAEDFQLENREIVRKYNLRELAAIYNGIGPDAFPDWLRNSISALHRSLAPASFIHDIEWHESDGTPEAFTVSNERFRQNGYRTAKALFGWYDPRRYIVMNQARRFANCCQYFGWNGWASPCQCGVCKKVQRGES